jgi:Carbohydrate-binding family 9
MKSGVDYSTVRVRIRRPYHTHRKPANMKRLIFLLIVFIGNVDSAYSQASGEAQETTPLLVKKCPDFNLTGTGDNTPWTKTEWNYLTQLDSGGKNYTSKFKMLYSDKGIYVLFYGDDEKISTQFDKDFGDLFKGDVFEVFFHTDPGTPIYLEYEVNQLNKELVLLVPSINGRAYGWIPWNYDKKRRVKKMINVVGGKEIVNGAMISWTAEIFFPYSLFNPLSNVPPASGTLWNANFYRLDYDTGKMIKWAWGPVQHSFHELERFRVIKFE